MRKIRVVQMGLGPIGNKVTQYLMERSNLEIVGAIDCDLNKVGHDIGELAGLSEPLGVIVKSSAKEVLQDGGVDIVILTTSSSLERVYGQLRELIEYGVNVVSTCEELSYPWLTNPQLSDEIDRLARKNHVSVLSTGINPGFLMDFLPLALTGLCRDVRKVTVERIQNAQFRRLPFQKKIGAGLTREEFQEKVQEGILRHVGLTESIHMIASRLGWNIEKTEDEISPVIAKERAVTEGLTVDIGNCLGVQQLGRGFIGGQEVISLIFRAAIGEDDVRDRIIIEGTPPVELSFKGGVNGDIGTCAIVVNSIPSVINARPGLRTMADIEAPAYFK